MTYATAADFIRAFGEAEAIQVTNLDDPTAQEVDVSVLDGALVDASAEIDRYLQGRYSLPLPSLPRALVKPCVDIARFNLDRLDPREHVRQRYEDAIRYLEQLAKGVVSLGLGQDSQDIPSTGSPQFLQSGRRVFGDDGLRGF